MPTLHESWDELKEKLLLCDNQSVEKRIGNDYTLVFEIDKLEYDASIPIITDDEVERWLEYRKNGSVKPQPTGETPLAAAGRHLKDEATKRESSLIKKPCVKKTPKRGSTSQKQIQEKKTIELICPAKPETSKVVKDKNKFKERELTSMWKCAIDQLIIKEPIDDEYAQYDDDDEPETELSKNLRKIRSDPPVTKQPPPLPPPKPAYFPTKGRDYQKVKTTPPQMAAKPPEVAKPPETAKPPEVAKPPEADWPLTAKALQANQFAIVYKDLAFFKSKIMANEQAISILKETVVKCIQEDETTLLTDILKIMYDLNYLDDCDFWSDLVKRLKRKLSNPGSNERPKYKTKTNPEWVFNNYQRAITSISDYARAVNLTAKLPFHLFLFLAFPLKNSDEVAKVELKKVEPAQDEQKAGEPPKVELDKIELKKVEPMQEQNLNCTDMSPIVTHPTKAREVKLLKKDDGNVYFMISKRKKKGTSVP